MIADHIFSNLSGADRQLFRSSLQKATFFDIQNIADYYYQYTAGRDNLVYPNVAPPWPLFWCEWKQPEYANTDLPNYEKIKVDKHFRSFGVLVSSSEEKSNVGHHNMRWSLCFTVFSPSFPDDPNLASATVAVSDAGLVIDEALSDLRMSLKLRDAFFDVRSDKAKTREEIQLEVHRILNWLAVAPILLALSFANCKNVKRVANDVDKSILKMRRRVGKLPIERHYTLEIDPMRKILRDEGQIETVGLKRALHICRGHFAEYGPEFGKGKLFGKLEGRYWMPQHIRGSAEIGTVKKDYAVKAPL